MPIGNYGDKFSTRLELVELSRKCFFKVYLGGGVFEHDGLSFSSSISA